MKVDAEIKKLGEAASNLPQQGRLRSAEGEVGKVKVHRAGLVAQRGVVREKLAKSSDAVDEALRTGGPESATAVLGEVETDERLEQSYARLIDQIDTRTMPDARANEERAKVDLAQAITEKCDEFQRRHGAELRRQLSTILDTAWALHGGVRGVFAENGVEPTRVLSPLLPVRISDLMEKIRLAASHEEVGR